MARSTIKNVIFDMGGVLINFDGPYFSRVFTDTPEDAALLQAAYFGRTEWSLLDSGTIDDDTMTRVAEAHLPERLWPNLHACVAHWPEHSHPLDAANELAIRLKQDGYGIYLLSNASRRIGEQLVNLPVYPYLDGWMASAFERIMKPDLAIFRLFCLRYRLDPVTCLFVDDNADNCAGARVAGLKAFHYTGDVAALEAAVRG